MNNVMTDIWPFLLTAAITAIAGYVGYIHTLKTRVAVLEKTIENLSKTIESMQKRMDSHSKKQDDILTSVNTMRFEVLKQIGSINTQMGILASDVKNMQSLITISDMGVHIEKGQKS